MDIVYKFLPPERTTYLDDELLRLTQPDALNDPFECIPIISREESHSVALRYIEHERMKVSLRQDLNRNGRHALEKAVSALEKKIWRDLKSDPDFFRRKFFNDGRVSLNSKIGILSLARRWDSTLMWSHYSTSHQGFCVGFNRGHDFFVKSALSPDGSSILKPVIYSDARIKTPLVKGKRIDMAVMYTKSMDWKYEEEERLVGLLELATKKVPFNPWPLCLIRVPHEAICELVVGARAVQQLQKKVLEIGAELGCRVYRTSPSDASFNMIRAPMNGASSASF